MRTSLKQIRRWNAFLGLLASSQDLGAFADSNSRDQGCEGPKYNEIRSRFSSSGLSKFVQTVWVAASRKFGDWKENCRTCSPALWEDSTLTDHKLFRSLCSDLSELWHDASPRKFAPSIIWLFLPLTLFLVVFTSRTYKPPSPPPRIVVFCAWSTYL